MSSKQRAIRRLVNTQPPIAPVEPTPVTIRREMAVLRARMEGQPVRSARKSRHPVQATTAPTPIQPSPVAVQAEMDALSDRFHGYPAGLSSCLRAVGADDVLTTRIHEAVRAGWVPVDLVSTPRHRRAQVIEDSLDALAKATEGGPCSLCGTKRRRRGWFPRGLMDDADLPRFHVATDGTARCAWCQEYLMDHSEDDLLETVFRRLTGIKWEVFHKVLGATAVPSRGDGTPWSHVDPTALRAIVVKDERYTGFHIASRPWERQHLQGLPEVFVWDEVPRVLAPQSIPPTPAAKRMAQDAARAVQRFAADKEKAACDVHRNLAGIFARDMDASPMEATWRFNDLVRQGKSSEQALAIIKRELAKASA